MNCSFVYSPQVHCTGETTPLQALHQALDSLFGDLSHAIFVFFVLFGNLICMFGGGLYFFYCLLSGSNGSPNTKPAMLTSIAFAIEWVGSGKTSLLETSLLNMTSNTLAWGRGDFINAVISLVYHLIFIYRNQVRLSEVQKELGWGSDWGGGYFGSYLGWG